MEEMEKRSDRHIPDLVAHTAFKGLDANEIGCARISVMAGGQLLPSKGRIQMSNINYLQAAISDLQRTAGPHVPEGDVGVRGSTGRDRRAD